MLEEMAIGLYSPKDFGFGTLGMGVTFCVFHWVGNLPSLNTLLNKSVKGSAKRWENFLRTHEGKPSGPAVDLFGDFSRLFQNVLSIFCLDL